MSNNVIPETNLDLFTDEALTNPYPHYRELRDAGAAVWLKQNEVFAISRYKDVKETLRNWQVFSSAEGVALNEFTNQAIRGATLASDTPLHDQLRGVISKPLTPGAVRELTDQIVKEAEDLAETLVSRGQFDAVGDLAWHLPLTIVSHLVGIPEEFRVKMPGWAAAGFNALGPMNERAQKAMPSLQEIMEFLFSPDLQQKLKPGSWGARLFEAAERGEITREQCPSLMSDYLGPSLDTTASAIGSAIWLFSQHPEQWQAIREDASLIPNAVLEVVRMESPIAFFTRHVTQDVEIEGIKLPQGSRAMVLYGSANRDERKWEDPERFDIRRKVVEQLGFGHGVHTCVGMHLAQLEIRSLLAALAKRVERFELGKPERALNNCIRSFARLPVSVH